MKRLETFIDNHFRKIAMFLLVVILFNTCGNPTKPLNKKVEALSAEVDSLSTELSKRPTAKDIRIIGLKEAIYRIDSKNRTNEELTLSQKWHKELDSLEK